MSLLKKITRRRKSSLSFFSIFYFETLFRSVSVWNNLECTSSPVWATYHDCSQRHRCVSGPEFQFRQIKACRFRTFSRPAERGRECILPSPAAWHFPRIPEMLLCQCAICWMTIWILSRKKKNIEDMLGVISSIRTNLPNPSVCSVFPFFSHTPRAARSSKSTRGADKLGQLLHRLVSKPRYVSVRGISLVI